MLTSFQKSFYLTDLRPKASSQSCSMPQLCPVAQAFNPATWEAEARSAEFQGQLWKPSETISKSTSAVKVLIAKWMI